MKRNVSLAEISDGRLYDRRYGKSGLSWVSGLSACAGAWEIQ